MRKSCGNGDKYGCSNDICVEGSGEINGGQRGKSVCCVLNCESFIHCPIIDGVKEQEKAEELFWHEGEGSEKQRRGRPKKKSKRFPRGNLLALFRKHTVVR